MKLTRAVARALGKKGLRMRILQDLRKAPYLEHKLHLQSYLSGERGGILRAAMRQKSDLGPDEIDDVLNRAPDLEFYMPVVEHRRSWTGGPDVVIASALDDADEPVGFDVRGNSVGLDPDSPPPEPVLVLVPVETDFSEPIDRAAFDNRDDAGGEAIGQYRPKNPSISMDILQPCPGCGGGGDDGGTTGARVKWDLEPDGIYLDRTWYQELGESWTKGSPELEVFTFIEDDSDGEGEGARCVGENEFGTRFYEQDDHFWTAQNSTDDVPQLATQQQVSELPGDRGFLFVVYEDDAESCVVKDDKDNVNDALDLVQAGVELEGIDRIDGESILTAVQTFITIVEAGGNLIQTNDDLIGFIVEQQCTDPDGRTYTHTVLRDGTDATGCVNLKGNF